MQFVQIPAGRFAMGSDAGQDDERPVHEVEVDAFECAVFPVTQEEYAQFLAATGHEVPRDWRGVDASRPLPVTGVSWFDALEFCDWHRRRGDPMRLPTEAEWEYAARSGASGAEYPWPQPPRHEIRANTEKSRELIQLTPGFLSDWHESGAMSCPAWIPNGGRGPLDGPWPVDVGEPNAFGIVGIGTNIHEWCADWHAADYYAQSPVRNPQGPPAGTRRASRGGAWRHAITFSRCAQRSKIDPSFRYSDYGFRLVRA
jgi:formylglycine-generating enzyme required for sulfatase activity